MSNSWLSSPQMIAIESAYYLSELLQGDPPDRRRHIAEFQHGDPCFEHGSVEYRVNARHAERSNVKQVRRRVLISDKDAELSCNELRRIFILPEIDEIAKHIKIVNQGIIRFYPAYDVKGWYVQCSQATKNNVSVQVRMRYDMHEQGLEVYYNVLFATFQV